MKTVFLLFFNDSNYTNKYKKLAGIFSTKDKALSAVPQLLEKNGSGKTEMIYNDEILLKNLIKDLSRMSQVEVEEDFCLSLEDIVIDEVLNNIY